jgi:hypothetical protein
MPYYVTSYTDVSPDALRSGASDIHTYHIRTTPDFTNSSHERRAKGWLGTTNDTNANAHGEFETLPQAIAFIEDQGLISWSDPSILDAEDMTEDWEHQKPFSWEDCWWSFVLADDDVLVAARARPTPPDEVNWFYADWWNEEAQDWPEYVFGDDVAVAFYADPGAYLEGRKVGLYGFELPDLTDKQWASLEAILDEHGCGVEATEYLNDIGYETEIVSGENGYDVTLLLTRPMNRR